MFLLECLTLRALRRRLYPFATGQVLELGVGDALRVGTGVNLPLYAPHVDLVAVDVDGAMLRHSRERPTQARASLVQADATSLPFAGGSFDRVVGSLVFCSIADPVGALSEARRVLRPRGWLVLLEHVRGARGVTRTLTDWLDRPWHRLTGSCHLNRDTADAVRDAGFELVCAVRHMFGLIQIIVARKSAPPPKTVSLKA